MPREAPVTIATLLVLSVICHLIFLGCAYTSTRCCRFFQGSVKHRLMVVNGRRHILVWIFLKDELLSEQRGR
jgi:hypothetical protein